MEHYEAFTFSRSRNPDENVRNDPLSPQNVSYHLTTLTPPHFDGRIGDADGGEKDDEVRSENWWLNSKLIRHSDLAERTSS